MADDIKTKPAAPAPIQTVEVEIVRGYWPKTQPVDWPADEEYRVRPGERVTLPIDEAMDVIGAGIALRVKA